jgi:hypothetical protein
MRSVIPHLEKAAATVCVAIFFVGTMVARSVSAQTPASRSPFAVIEGVAIDSVHQDFLRGALITVEGSEGRATTDEQGRFRIDSIPPGLRRVEIIHPLLDTLGVSLQTAPLQLAAGQRVRITVSTPSVTTVLAKKCTAGERSVGPVALLGTVEYAESESPAVGARVIMEWTEHRVTSKTIEMIPRTRTATVSEDGRFRICGLPEDVSGALTAIGASDSTSAVDVHIRGPIGVLGLTLPEPPAARTPATPTGARAVLTGRVLDPNGAPLARARVSIVSDSSYAITAADGRFTIRNLPTGTRMVSVRRLGFEPTEIPVGLRNSRPTDVTIRLGPFVAVLDTVRIFAATEQRALDRVGFTRRKTLGTGFYITPEEIDRRNAFDLTDLLRMAPMLRTTSTSRGTTIGGRGTQISMSGGSTGFAAGCVNYFVDGAPWQGSDVTEFISPREVSAIEVYSKGFTPARFRSGISDCETVVIWTKVRIR